MDTPGYTALWQLLVEGHCPFHYHPHLRACRTAGHLLTVREESLALGRVFQHGYNPEHSMTLGEKRSLSSGPCYYGFALDDWLERLHAYEGARDDDTRTATDLRDLPASRIVPRHT
jgi:hypothetical protein